MSIASRIQEMETHIGNAYTSIDNLGIDISNTNKNIYNISTLLDTFYESLPKVNGKGSNLSLSPTKVGKIKLNGLYGNTSQTGTPTPDSPIPIECVTGNQNVTISNSDSSSSNTYEVNLGKNLFDSDTIIPNMISSVSTQTPFSYNSSTKELTITNSSNDTYLPAIWGNANYINGINIDVEKNTTYTFRFTASQPDSTLKNAVFGLNKSTNKYEYIEVLSQKSSFTFNTGNYDVITFRLGSTATTGTVTIFSNFQLEKGNATSYSPYFTPIELNNIPETDYKDSIKKSTGKNLFDKDTIIEGKYIDASGNFINDNNNFIGDFISIDNTKSYYISALSGQPKRIVYYDSSKSFISRELITATGGALTIPNNTRYVRLSCYNQDLNTLQLEQGTSSSSYEPYGKVWYITKNIGKKVLDGTEDWSYQSTFPRFFANNFNIGQISTASLLSLSLCNYFKVGQTANTNNTFGLGSNALYMRYEDKTTKEQFTSWLGTYKPEIKYILATPTYEVITNTTLIEQLETLSKAKSKNGTTNIVITSQDLPMLMDVSVIKGDA